MPSSDLIWFCVGFAIAALIFRQRDSLLHRAVACRIAAGRPFVVSYLPLDDDDSEVTDITNDDESFRLN